MQATPCGEGLKKTLRAHALRFWEASGPGEHRPVNLLTVTHWLRKGNIDLVALAAWRHAYVNDSRFSHNCCRFPFEVVRSWDGPLGPKMVATACELQLLPLYSQRASAGSTFLLVFRFSAASCSLLVGKRECKKLRGSWFRLQGLGLKEGVREKVHKRSAKSSSSSLK